ncbi:MAG: hypothetical protein FWF36_06785 [Propionibacteriaceae bacterium]|nr:hypothetical protein [Propionibacteriaceae bacterium]
MKYDAFSGPGTMQQQSDLIQQIARSLLGSLDTPWVSASFVLCYTFRRPGFCRTDVASP